MTTLDPLAASCPAPRAETERVLRSEAFLADAIMEVGPERNGTRVVKVTVFLSDWTNFPGMNEVFVELFGTEEPPARSTIQGERWPEGSLVAIEAIALAE